MPIVAYRLRGFVHITVIVEATQYHLYFVFLYSVESRQVTAVLVIVRGRADCSPHKRYISLRYITLYVNTGFETVG